LQPRPESVFHHHVAMADPASFHFHTHLPRPWLGNIAFDQLEVAARLAYLGGFHHSYRHTFSRHTALSALLERHPPRSPPDRQGAHQAAIGCPYSTLRENRWSSTNNIRTVFGGGTSDFQPAQAIYLSLERR